MIENSKQKIIKVVARPAVALNPMGEFACLKVIAVEQAGAYLRYGLRAEVYLPATEQTRPLQTGLEIIVYIAPNQGDRRIASMRLERHSDQAPGQYKIGQKVDLLIFSKTDLGFKAIINGRHMGVLFANEVFQTLKYGQKTVGFIKNIREDGKIDLILQELGHRAALGISEQIMEMLKQKDGFLAVDSKTTAETVYELFGVSKKKFKMALGGLYKKRLITIDNAGIHLAKK